MLGRTFHYTYLSEKPAKVHIFWEGHKILQNGEEIINFFLYCEVFNFVITFPFWIVFYVDFVFLGIFIHSFVSFCLISNIHSALWLKFEIVRKLFVFGSKRALLQISQWPRWLSLGTMVEIRSCPKIVCFWIKTGAFTHFTVTLLAFTWQRLDRPNILKLGLLLWVSWKKKEKAILLEK